MGAVNFKAPKQISTRNRRGNLLTPVAKYVADRRRHMSGRHRGAEENTLAELASGAAEPLVLTVGLDPFSNQGHRQTIAQRTDGFQEQVIMGAPAGRADEGLINLDEFCVQQHEIGERGEPGTGVIEGISPAEAIEGLDDRQGLGHQAAPRSR